MMVEQIKDDPINDTNMKNTVNAINSEVSMVKDFGKRRTILTKEDTIVSQLTMVNGHVKESNIQDTKVDSENEYTQQVDEFWKDFDESMKLEMRGVVSKEFAQVAPLLVGRYVLKDNKAVWSGRWGMNEAAFTGTGITSPFEMISENEVQSIKLQGDSESVHPAWNTLTKAPFCQDTGSFDSKTVTPVHFGYENDKNKHSPMPFSSKYGGFFQIQASKNKPQTVVEKNVDISFVHDISCPKRFVVTGSGENRFGIFTLHGLLDKKTNILRVFKVYKPKEKEKKGVVRRGRTPRAAAQAGLSKIQNRPVLSVIAPTTPSSSSIPTPTTSISGRRQSRLQIRLSTPSAQSVYSDTQASTPASSTGSPSVRNRSSRKRVVPAHLREENILDSEKAPVILKKCLGILKNLMSNSKAVPFLNPVDPIALGIPDYFKVIKEPMDLGTVKHNLENGAYCDASIFVDHVRLVFNNAMLYNAAHSQVHISAQKLMDDFDKRLKAANVRYTPKASKSLFNKSKTDDKMKLKQTSKKVRGGKGAKGNTKRRMSHDDQGLINSLREDIERLKATLEQLQPATSRGGTPRPMKTTSRPFRMEDLTEDELNKPMSKWEISKLSADIKLLPQNKISRVLQIISEAVPVANLVNENDEIELDFESFDTRCLRMLEGYVRESDVSRKRKRPAKKAKVVPPESRLKSAKLAAVNIRNRQEELRNELAQMEGSHKPVEAKETGNVIAPKTDISSSEDSSSSSSDSSDSDNESESDSELENDKETARSPVVSSGSLVAQRFDVAKKIRDEVPSEPLIVENKGAWSMLAKKETQNEVVTIKTEVNQSSSLWLSARSMEQMKQEKLKQEELERHEELEAQKRRDLEKRAKEKERERAEVQLLKEQQEKALRLAQEEKLREAERARAKREADGREHPISSCLDNHTNSDQGLSEDFESFSSSSFL